MHTNAIKSTSKHLCALTVCHLCQLRIFLLRHGKPCGNIFTLSIQIAPPVFTLLDVHSFGVKICVLNICRRQLLTNLFGLHQIQFSGLVQPYAFFSIRNNLQCIKFGKLIWPKPHRRHIIAGCGAVLLLPLFCMCPRITTRENNHLCVFVFYSAWLFFYVRCQFHFLPLNTLSIFFIS